MHDHRPTSPLDAVRVLSRGAARELDRLAVEELGIPSIVLMENAARGAAERVCELAASGAGRCVLAVAGPGNNGGDAFAAARHLHNAGFAVTIAACFAGNGKGDAATNLAICRRMGLDIRQAESGNEAAFESDLISAAAELCGLEAARLIVLDGVFGTGLTSAPRGAAAVAIRAINALRAMGARVVALDCPSGLDAQTGEAFDPVVTADRTVTFAAAKPGLLALAAQPFVGELVVASIGVPEALVDRLAERIPPRRDAGPERDDDLRPLAAARTPGRSADIPAVRPRRGEE